MHLQSFNRKVLDLLSHRSLFQNYFFLQKFFVSQFFSKDTYSMFKEYIVYTEYNAFQKRNFCKIDSCITGITGISLKCISYIMEVCEKSHNFSKTAFTAACFNFLCRTNDNLDKSSKPYNVHAYKFSFTEDEVTVILNYINNWTEDEFCITGLSKVKLKSLIRHRDKYKIDSISDLLDIDGFGIKNVENMCRHIVLYSLSALSSSTVTKQKPPRKSFVKPSLSLEKAKSLKEFVAIDINPSYISWTGMNRHGNVTDIDSLPLFTSIKRLETNQIYEMIEQAVNEIPLGDAYIWEDKPQKVKKYSAADILIAMQLAQAKGILYALLTRRIYNSHLSYVFIQKESVVSKLFDLQVGGERISWLAQAREIMTGASTLTWFSTSHILQEELLHKFDSYTEVLQKHIATSILLAVSFHEAALMKNMKALNKLSS